MGTKKFRFKKPPYKTSKEVAEAKTPKNAIIDSRAKNIINAINKKVKHFENKEEALKKLLGKKYYEKYVKLPDFILSDNEIRDNIEKFAPRWIAGIEKKQRNCSFCRAIIRKYSKDPRIKWKPWHCPFCRTGYFFFSKEIKGIDDLK